MRVRQWLLGLGLGWAVAADSAVACSGDNSVTRLGNGGGSNGGNGSGTGGGTATGGDASVIFDLDGSSGGEPSATCDAEAGCIYTLPDAGPYCGDGVVNGTDEA